MDSRRAFTTAALLLLCVPIAAAAQDEGTFIIRQGGREIGREDFTVQVRRVGGSTGTTLLSRFRYPAVAPEVEGRVTVERRQDGSLAAAEFEVEEGRRSRRVLVEVGSNVLRIQTSAGGTQAVREMAASGGVVVLDDSVFALYAVVAEMATAGGQALVGVFPRSGRRVSFTARREPAGDDTKRDRILLAGGITGILSLDEGGHLQRVEFSGAMTEAVRLHR